MSAYQLRRTTRASLATGLALKPSWKVAYFLTGTSTPTPVYTTYERNVAHTQPVQADSGGVLPPIYFDPSIVYKEEVYDENDVLQYTDDPVNDQLLSQDVIGAHLWPQEDLESVADITPDTSEAPGDVRRMGVVGDGLTDDTAALQKCFTVGGAWKVPSGLILNLTAPITVVKATRLYSDSPANPYNDNANPTQAQLRKNHAGNMFEITGDAASNQIGDGVWFERLSFIQWHGDGSGASGICFNAVATDDNARINWPRFIGCFFEQGAGKNQWEGGLNLDGMATSGNSVLNRDAFIQGCRFVAGPHASYSIRLAGCANVTISDTQCNLTNGDLIITGDATHQTSASINGSTFDNITMDWARGVKGAGNSAATVTSTVNTIDCELGCVCSGSNPTLLGTRVTVYGRRNTGEWTVTTTDTVRFEMGLNILECSGPIDTEEAYKVDGTQVLSARITGWGAPTGTPTRTTFATGSVTLPQLAERVKALIDDLTTHGVIGT